jgi:hypothetical protein
VKATNEEVCWVNNLFFLSNFGMILL